MEDLLEQAPRTVIRASRLWELAKENAVLIPLSHQWGSLQAYRIDAHGGPYLMLADQVALYRAKCHATHP